MELTARDIADLTWFVQHADADVSGLGAQNYSAVGGGTCDPDPGEWQLRCSKRYRTIEEVRQRMLEIEGGLAAWGVLAIAFGPPRRDDPLPVYEERNGKRVCIQAGFPAEIATLARYTQAAREAGARMAEAEELSGEVSRFTTEVLRLALEKKSDPLLVEVRVQARQMLEDAGTRWIVARREIAAEQRMARAPETTDPLLNLSGLLERMRASEPVSS
jgi:hypothetical protein